MKKKVLSIIMAVTLVMLTVVGCSSKEVVIKDREGREIKVPNKIDRHSYNILSIGSEFVTIGDPDYRTNYSITIYNVFIQRYFLKFYWSSCLHQKNPAMTKSNKQQH